jgi:hypothetical protein
MGMGMGMGMGMDGWMDTHFARNGDTKIQLG